MEFIDHTGHVFSLPSFDDKPVALQYTENDYIFWVKDNPVSIDNYYILPIRFLLSYEEYITDLNEKIDEYSLDIEDAFKLKVSLDSQFYKLIGPKYVQTKLENNNNINEPIKFNLNDFKSELTLSDFYYSNEEDSTQNIIVYNGENKFLVFPFYVICKSDIEGTYLTNINIEIQSYKKSTTDVQIKLESDEMFDFYMKKIVSDIKIYEYNQTTHERKLWYTIHKGYNRAYDEILFPSEETIKIGTTVCGKETYSSLSSILKPYEDEHGRIIRPENHNCRITHFDSFRNHLPDNVFVYIHKLPKNKWLLNYDIYEREPDGLSWKLDPNTGEFIKKENATPSTNNEIIYFLEGSFKRSCHYCGSTIRVNFDGCGVAREIVDGETPEDGRQDEEGYWITKWNKRTSSNRYPNGRYVYDDDMDGNEPKNTFVRMELSSFGRNKDSGGYTFNPNAAINLGYASNENGDGKDMFIRDFWFDIDLKLDENVYECKPEKEYTPITIGCTFIDECEELIINGQNMGINLPKEILKAFYNSSFYNKYSDEKLLKNKMKELLLNYMSIKGECGNFKSVINSLKWFGWSDKVEISKLIKTDNEFQNQYILDYFSINTDLKETYKYFNTTNLVSLSVKGNNETGEFDGQDISKVLIGEGMPLLEDLFDKNVEVTYDELKFFKPYYDFMFNELALKLDCLAYYWQKYFLPIHLKINRASIEYKVYANATKMTAAGFEKIVEDPVMVHINNTNVDFINVLFPETNEVLFYKSIHYIDSKFNEFSNYDDDYNIEDLYYVNENCISIPIKIQDEYNCFSYDEYGDYVLIDGEYIKPYKMYIFNETSLIETDDPKLATYYKLYTESTEFDAFEDVERYSKITEGYFSCKIFLSYFDNETNEEKYLVKDNTFNFYQSINQYYTNYVIIPRLIKDKSFDWLNTKFRLAIVINNKWYTYDFTVHVPNIYLDLGKLNYRYYVGEDTTMFKQIKSIESNKINFNSFMYQPDLVTIDTLFYDKDNERVMTFIEKLIEINGNQNKMYEFYKQYYKNKIKIPYNKKYYNRIHIFDIYEYSEDLTILELYENIKSSLGTINQWYKDEHYNDFFETRLKLEDFNNDLDQWIPYIVTEIINVYKQDNILPINKVSIWRGSEESIEIYDLYIKDNILYAKPVNPKNEKIKYLNNPFDITLYNQFFDGNYNFKVNFIENCEYDAYLMHDNIYSETYTNEEVDAHNSQFDIWDETTVKEIIEQDPNAITIQPYDPDHPIQIDGNTIIVYYTQEEINEHNAQFDIWEYGKIKNIEMASKKAYWYVVLISRYPIDNYREQDLTIHQREYVIGNYKLKYSDYSIDKFLVNRMDVIKTNGMNHFNQDDLVVATINNNNYQFNIDLENKWEIKRVFDENDSTRVTSNTNMIIVPNNTIDNLYKVGYYDIKLNYTINGLNDQLYFTQGKFRINNGTNGKIKYPKIKEIVPEVYEIPFTTKITDFKIMYEDDRGNRKYTQDILDSTKGYHPIGIKIVNAGYFTPNSPAIYMGLCQLSTRNPDTGFKELGDQTNSDIPYFGFYGHEIVGLKRFKYICYCNEEHTKTTTMMYPQTDNFECIPIVDETTPLYPAPNGRGWHYNPETSTNYCINLLNDDDTYNMNLIDDTCAAFDWDGWTNTQIMINNFDYDFSRIRPELVGDNWKTLPDLIYYGNAGPTCKFSLMCACAWRYHTRSTNQGDWYIPAYADVFFLTYNYKKYQEIFERLNELYPEDCKGDLLSSLYRNQSALWTTTACENDTSMWEIHPCYHVHTLGRSTKWQSIPFINITDNNA